MFNSLAKKTFYIAGVANKKSVAYHVAKILLENNAHLIFSAQNEKNLLFLEKSFSNSPSFILDVENKEQLETLAKKIKEHTDQVDGFLHSLAFANFNPETPSFHQTTREDFLQACQISCFSLVEMANKILPLLADNASIVTVGISNTKATSYGYLGPIKAMLEATVPYLAKSLGANSNIRVNCVAAGPLKTSASAGIPNYIENYLYSEALTLRKKALETKEVAQTICFLLSVNSSGINAETLTVDCGMNSNYFDQDIIKTYSKNL